MGKHGFAGRNTQHESPVFECFLYGDWGRRQRVVFTTPPEGNPPDHRKETLRKEASGGVVKRSKLYGGC